jgi:predicted DNA-binding transcriptional regulator AlpA
MADTQFADLPRFAPRTVTRYSPDDLMTSAAVREMLGGITDMTLWRWTHNLAFPKPDFVLSRRKYWRHATVHTWLVAHASSQSEVA